MGWLVGPTLASFFVAFLVVKLFDHIFAGVTGSVIGIARFSLFVGTWTAVSTKGAMHGITKKVRALRQANASAKARFEALVKDNGTK